MAIESCAEAVDLSGAGVPTAAHRPEAHRADPRLPDPLPDANQRPNAAVESGRGLLQHLLKRLRVLLRYLTGERILGTETRIRPHWGAPGPEDRASQGDAVV